MNCRVCGRQFDPNGFQILVPGMKHGFDRVDCALEASALGLPAARQPELVPAVVRALPAPLAAVPAFAGGSLGASKPESMRPQLLAGANIALLAAGTAATIYLWLRVFGADAGPLSFPAASASAAFGRSTVPAEIDTSPAPEARPQPESAVGGGGSQPATTTPATEDGGATLVSNQSGGSKASSRTGGPAVRPSNPPPAPPPPPPSEPGPTRSAPVPTHPVPTSPPDDRIPGPTLPGGGHPQPTVPDGGTRPGSG
jgi:hypothetical protein